MRIEIDVQDGSGDPMTHLVLEPEVVLGSGADATIRVRSERLAPRHLLLVPRGRRGCWVSSNPRALDPTIVGSQTLGNGLVPWGTELRIGETCVRLRRTFGHAPIVAIGALLAVFALVAVVLEAQKDSGSAPLTGRPSPPSRSLALESSSVCPGPGEALAVAQRQEREALLRHEQIPTHRIKLCWLSGASARRRTATGLPTRARRLPDSKRRRASSSPRLKRPWQPRDSAFATRSQQITGPTSPSRLGSCSH